MADVKVRWGAPPPDHPSGGSAPLDPPMEGLGTGMADTTARWGVRPRLRVEGHPTKIY